MSLSPDFSSGSSTGCARRSIAGTGRPMRRPIVVACAALAVACASGCSRAVLVPESSPVRIGPETRARIYVMTDGEWRLSDNRVEIPEGWYCVPPSYVEDE